MPDDTEKNEVTSEPRDFEQAKETGRRKDINAASNTFRHPETGAVYDASPEGPETRGEASRRARMPELNPVTKSYKADFPDRNEALQNYAPLVSSVRETAE